MISLETLIKENNEMLKFICKYIMNKGTPEQQNMTNLTYNLFADLLVDNLPK